MRWSQTLIPTLRNPPKDAEAMSHILGIRSGLVRQLSSGVYSYLPLGLRVLQKIMAIIREEMSNAGAEEVLLPALHPAELWKKSGRFETLGEDKISFKNRAGHEFVLGPTHEEVITDLVANSIHSFRDLPISLYQIQTKFRDEARPRYGVIRTKEFIMKDAYSFDRDYEGLDINYNKMSDAYRRIFNRCGLQFEVVKADSGMMGGNMSQEFMVECPYGEDRVAKSNGGYMASMDIAERSEPKHETPHSQSSQPEIFDTPETRTIEEISNKYGFAPNQIVKTIIYMADGKAIAALVSGDSDVNESKLRKLVKCQKLILATPKEIIEVTHAPVGFAGPVGLSIPIYADWDIRGMADFVTGANQKDKHFKNVNLNRDFQVSFFGDIRNVREGDAAPDGSGPLRLTTTMEVGHIFKLGTRYSVSMGASFSDETGKKNPIIMGCYGIGVNRIMAAAMEQNYDDKGMKWPRSISPFDVHIITVNQKDSQTVEIADKVHQALEAQRYEVLYDDRDERAGVKFTDADLIGIPTQIVIGERNLKEGVVEIKSRRTGESKKIPVDSMMKLLLTHLFSS